MEIPHVEAPPLAARLTILVVVLVTIWIIWSGMFKALLLELGVLSIAVTVLLAHRMRLDDSAIFALDLVPRVLGFWAWLVKEIVKSNFQVARIVLSPRMETSPTVLELRPHIPGLVAQATLANCITLTPGTLTFDAESGVFRVHCLTRAGAQELAEGEMIARIARAFGDR